MKKFLMIFMALTFSAAMSFVSAQRCTIKGATDGGSIEVMGCSHSGSNIVVTVANDSQASAKVFISVTYDTNKGKGKTVSTPYPVWVSGNTPSQKIEISVDLANNEQILSERVTSISGSKCDQ